uniref:Uncharacterized protein n=1 Tax=Rhizophora mucronata TaxID=61149 RepID=A0A2P2QDV4_RHIMU
MYKISVAGAAPQMAHLKSCKSCF